MASRFIRLHRFPQILRIIERCAIRSDDTGQTVTCAAHGGNVTSSFIEAMYDTAQTTPPRHFIIGTSEAWAVAIKSRENPFILTAVYVVEIVVIEMIATSVFDVYLKEWRK
ncbi:MAG: hypothetical protein WC208_11330 [Gallionella sp.]|jgi:hypothetical protein